MPVLPLENGLKYNELVSKVLNTVLCNKTDKRVSFKCNALNLNGIDYSSVSIQPHSIRKLIKVTRLESSKSQFVQSYFPLLFLRYT